MLIALSNMLIGISEPFDLMAMADGMEKSWPGCRLDTSAFVEKLSGSSPCCP